MGNLSMNSINVVIRGLGHCCFELEKDAPRLGFQSECREFSEVYVTVSIETKYLISK